MSPRGRFSSAVFAIAATLATLIGCGRHESDAESDAARGSVLRPLRIATMSAAERRYGVSPTLNDEITYQPDVIVIENGADAIRGLSDDGLTWHVAADAVRDVAVGKIVFLTSRAVGRVLQITRAGAQVDLLLGPIELTDLIRDCNLSMDSPVDFTDALTYSLPNMPGQTTPFEAMADASESRMFMQAHNTSNGGQYSTLLWSGDDARSWLLPTQTGRIEPFTTDAINNEGGLGVSLSKEENGVRIEGHAKLKVNRPRLTIHIIISKGELMVAQLRVHGAIGLNLGFLAINSVGRNGNINQRYVMPEDISVPIGGVFPLTITIRQQFIVQTLFTSTGMLKALGNYGFGGTMGVGYSKPDWSVFAPGNVSGLGSLQDSIEGSTLGVGAVSFTHQIKVIGGIGAFNFVVGPYVFLASNVNVTRHSDLDTLARCIYTGFNLDAGIGVGYVLPQPIVSFINAVLRTLNLREIAGEGGAQGPRKRLVESRSVRPQSDACKNETASSQTV